MESRSQSVERRFIGQGMSSVSVEYDALNKRLQKMRDNLTNANKFTGEMAILLKKDVMDHFEKEESSDEPWPSLKYRSGKPLRDTGRLFNSLQEFNTKEYAKVATNLEYAAIHNFGGQTGRGGKVMIPRRQYMWLSQTMQDNILKLAAKYFTGGNL